ncbi:MAG: hypothetical protein WC784_04780 [Candidatus Shapirobacteria bacterium]|jgi:hypothetical protein
MEKTPRMIVTGMLLAATAIGTSGCARLANGEEATVTKDTSCLQCPENYSGQDCSVQKNYGTVSAGTKVTADDNEYGFHQDGGYVRVNPHYLEGQKGTLISHEDICWVNGNDLKK